MLSKDVRNIVVWFCASCGSANDCKDFDCDDCGASFTKECLVFNLETFQAAIPESQILPEPYEEPPSPYWNDGAVSCRKPRESFAVWDG